MFASVSTRPSSAARFDLPLPLLSQQLPSIQMLTSLVTIISITSIHSVGSLSGAQCSMLNACKTGEVGGDMGLMGREGTGDVMRLKLGEVFSVRSRRLTFENIAWHADGLGG